MRQIRQFRHIFACLPGLWLATAPLSLLPRAAAQEDLAAAEEERLPASVEALRDALRIPVHEPANKEDPAAKKIYQAQLDFRKKTLQERVNALHGVREFYLALRQEWRDEMERDEEVSKIDGALHKQVEDRFTQIVKDGLQSSRPAQQIAAADLLGEIGIKVRGTGTHRGLASTFAPDLATLLKDKNSAVVGSAAKALGRVNPDPDVATPALQSLLQTGTLPEKRAAAEGLVSLIQGIDLLSKGKGGRGVEAPREDTLKLSQGVVHVAARSLGDDNVAVRRQSALAIQKVGATLGELVSIPKQASELPPVGRELSEEEKIFVQDFQQEVKKELKELEGLARALGEQGRALGSLLKDPDADTRLQAARTLVELANAHAGLIRLADSSPPMAEEKKPADAAATPQTSLKQGLTAALPRLAHALGDPDVRVRLAAVSVLDLMDREAVVAVDALLKSLKDSDVFVRWAAARSLGNIDPTAGKVAVPELGRLLFDPDLDVRLAAATTLEHYGNQAGAAVEDLIRAVSVGDAEIRVAVIHALEAIGPEAKSAVPALAKALEDPEDRVRRAAAETLGRFGPLAQAAEPALRKALDDKENNVRRAVSAALLSVNQKQ